MIPSKYCCRVFSLQSHLLDLKDYEDLLFGVPYMLGV